MMHQHQHQHQQRGQQQQQGMPPLMPGFPQGLLPGLGFPGLLPPMMQQDHHQQHQHQHQHHHQHHHQNRGAGGMRMQMQQKKNEPHLSGSYVSLEGLVGLDGEGYKSAGVIMWRAGESGCEVLVGLDKKGELAVLGGMREKDDQGAVATALRQFKEEAGVDLTEAERYLTTVIWILGGKYALFPLCADLVSPETITQLSVPRPTPEMQLTTWQPLASLLEQPATQKYQKFISLISADPGFLSWASSPTNPTPSPPAEPRKCLPCKFHMTGTCTKGQSCVYLHAGKPGTPKDLQSVKCKFFVAGLCKNGPSCRYMH